jgi:hypothetical protein
LLEEAIGAVKAQPSGNKAVSGKSLKIARSIAALGNRFGDECYCPVNCLAKVRKGLAD